MKKLKEAEISKYENSFKEKETAYIAKAEKFRIGNNQGKVEDPLPEISPSLLSADDISRYVYKTGMVYPFSTEKRTTIEKPEKVHRLKSASYEGRIGSEAFIYDQDQSEPKSILSKNSKFLTFPANSIVFVASDVYFRLPPFVAVRFNLQIRHVHRGLLLGTGPLVDPGFWGKLCIPIHNLTDEDYDVPMDEGLIWIEFTKTTSYPSLGDLPSNTDLDKIKSSIDKASQPYKAFVDGDKNFFERYIFKSTEPKKVGIRSSISSKFNEAESIAKSAKTDAEDAKRSARRLSWTGIGALVFGSLIMYDLWTSYRGNVTTYEDNVRTFSFETMQKITDFQTELSSNKSEQKVLKTAIEDQANTIIKLQEQLIMLQETAAN